MAVSTFKRNSHIYHASGTITNGYITVMHNFGISGEYYPICQISNSYVNALVLYAVNSITPNSFNVGIATSNGYKLAPADGFKVDIAWTY